MSVVWVSLHQITKRPSDVTQQCRPSPCRVPSQRPPLTSPARPSEFLSMASFWMLDLVVPCRPCLKLEGLPLESNPSPLHHACRNLSYVLAAQSQRIAAALGTGWPFMFGRREDRARRQAAMQPESSRAGSFWAFVSQCGPCAECPVGAADVAQCV